MVGLLGLGLLDAPFDLDISQSLGRSKLLVVGKFNCNLFSSFTSHKWCKIVILILSDNILVLRAFRWDLLKDLEITCLWLESAIFVLVKGRYLLELTFPKFDV